MFYKYENHFILTTPWSRYYYPHFTDVDIEATFSPLANSDAGLQAHSLPHDTFLLWLRMIRVMPQEAPEGLHLVPASHEPPKTGTRRSEARPQTLPAMLPTASMDQCIFASQTKLRTSQPWSGASCPRSMLPASPLFGNSPTPACFLLGKVLTQQGLVEKGVA